MATDEPTWQAVWEKDRDTPYLIQLTKEEISKYEAKGMTLHKIPNKPTKGDK